MSVSPPILREAVVAALAPQPPEPDDVEKLLSDRLLEEIRIGVEIQFDETRTQHEDVIEQHSLVLSIEEQLRHSGFLDALDAAQSALAESRAEIARLGKAIEAYQEHLVDLRVRHDKARAELAESQDLYKRMQADRDRWLVNAGAHAETIHKLEAELAESRGRDHMTEPTSPAIAPPQPRDAERREVVPIALVEALKFFAETPHFKSAPFRHARALAHYIAYLRAELDAAQSALAESRAENERLNQLIGYHERLAAIEQKYKPRFPATEEDRERAYRLLIGEKVGAGDGHTHVVRSLDIDTLATEFAIVRAESRAENAQLRSAVYARRGFSSPGFEQGKQSEWDAAIEALDAADAARLRPPAAAREDREAARKAAQQFTEWVLADSGIDFWRECDAETVVENTIFAERAAARAQGVREGIEKAAEIGYEAIQFAHGWIAGMPVSLSPSFEDKRAAQAALELAKQKLNALAALEPQEEKP